MGQEIRKSLTHYLYAHPSFAEGVSRIWDFGGNLQAYNESDSEAEADKKALAKDWQAVGQDIKTAVTAYGRK